MNDRERTGAGLTRISDIAILDSGQSSIPAPEIARLARSVLDGGIPEFARDRNSVCYRAPLDPGIGIPGPVVLKAPRLGPQRTNEDVTFAREAAILVQMGKAGIADTYRLLARFRVGDTCFLLTTHVAGAPPDPTQNPLTAAALGALFDSLFEMDRRGLMHYDLKPANVLFDGDRPGFIDFEFRTLAQYLDGLRQAKGSLEADGFLLGYLHQRSAYHAQRGCLLEELHEDEIAQIAHRGELSPSVTRGRLAKAAASEKRLAMLLDDAHAIVADLEAALIAFRRDVFEDRRAEAQENRLRALERARVHVGTTVLPSDYFEALNHSFARVWRSHRVR